MTARDGYFVISAREAITHCNFTVSARGLAPQFVKDWVPRKRDQIIHMDRGVTVSGRVIRDGQPLSFVTVGLVQKNRSEGFFREPTK